MVYAVVKKGIVKALVVRMAKLQNVGINSADSKAMIIREMDV